MRRVNQKGQSGPFSHFFSQPKENFHMFQWLRSLFKRRSKQKETLFISSDTAKSLESRPKGSCYSSFIKRVHSFAVDKWRYSHRLRINPLELGRYGWVCISENVLRCSCCKQVIYFLPPFKDAPKELCKLNGLDEFEMKCVN